MVDLSLFHRILAEFASSLVRRHEVTNVMERLSEHVAEVLQADGAAVCVGIDERLVFLTATGAEVREIEQVQMRLQEGPCHDAWQEGATVVVRDITTETQRWPGFSPALLEVGLCSVMSVPMQLGGLHFGALNVFSRTERDWDEDEGQVTHVLADMATTYVLNSQELKDSNRTRAQLQTALDSRIVIEQAKGILAERHGVSVEQAFELMRRYVRSVNDNLHPFAAAVVAGTVDVPPPEASPRSA